METFFIKAAQLILAFAILVIIHEFGHFLFARMFGVKVEKFYIFFNPWFELFKWKPKSGKGFWGDTEYGIGWLPLGGYCKIAGMIDESMDKEQMSQPAKEWEFRSKPAWQRLLIMVAGVLFNLILAMFIYAGIVFATGEKYVPMNEAEMGFTFSNEAKKIGYQDGDIPILADGVKLTEPVEARMKMIQAKTVSVLRNGTDTVNISVPEKFIFALDEERERGDSQVNFFAYRMPTRITQVANGDGADKAGIKEGDVVLAIDTVKTPDLLTFLNTLKGHNDATVRLTIARQKGQVVDTITAPVKLSDNSKMGVGLEIDPTAFFKYEEKHYNLLESLPRGVEMGIDKLTSYASSMKLIFTKEGAQSIGGFGTLGSIFPDKWNWLSFWNIAAFLSVALAFMNILPIPALDGGHVLFLLYEVVTRRKPSEKFMEWAQMIGMGLLLLLLLYANGMDIIRLFK
jgi:regulator of sigma E protease